MNTSNRGRSYLQAGSNLHLEAGGAFAAFAIATTSLAAVTITDLGTLPGGTYSYGSAVNSNGTAVAGYADHSDDLGSGDRAFRWTVSGGMQDLGVLEGGASSSASGINYNGNFVTGTSGYFGGTHAFRWNAGTGIMEDLDELHGG